MSKICVHEILFGVSFDTVDSFGSLFAHNNVHKKPPKKHEALEALFLKTIPRNKRCFFVFFRVNDAAII